MTSQQMRAAHPLIENARNVRTSKATWRAMRMMLSPVSVVTAAIAWYRSELRMMLDAPAIFLGPGK